MALNRIGAAPRPIAPPAARPVIHRGNIEIYSAADLKKFENVTKVIGNLTIDIRGQKLSLPKLEQVEGDLTLGNNLEIELKNLKSVSKSIGVAGNPTLTRISMPKLETVGESMSVSSASYPLGKLTDLNLPALRQIGTLSVAWAGLRTLSFPKLKSVESLSIGDNKHLAAIGLPALKSVGQRVDFVGNPKLPSASLKALVQQLRAAGIDPAKIHT